MTNAEKQEMDSVLQAIDALLADEDYALPGEIIYQQRKKLAAPEQSNSRQTTVKQPAQGERQPGGHVHQWESALGMGQNVEICACGWTQWK